MQGAMINVPDLCASFQNAVVEPLVERTMKCAKAYGIKNVALAGGVSANSALRAAMKKACDENGFNCYYPEPVFCTDNAAMIAAAGYYDFLAGCTADTSLNADPSLKL